MAEREVKIRPGGIPARPKVFLDIQIGTEAPFRLVFELFYDIVPKTALNFLYLCTYEQKNFCISDNKKPLCFKGSRFHRVIPNFMAQGGDFTNFNGTGGESIYGTKFADEKFTVKHEQGGLLSMANAGKNTNGSQFFITFEATPWLDGKHVVFGKIIEGKDYLKDLEKQGQENGKPKSVITLVDCGEL